jgi:peptide deformylase
MSLVEHTDLILTTKCEPYNFDKSSENPVELAQSMVKIMYDNNALGLSANQIGLNYRVFAMRGYPENFVCFNPKIVMSGEEQVVLEETNPCYPGLVVKIKRPQHVRVRFQTPNGETRTETFTGMTARIFQHQLDILDGIAYYNKANKYHKDLAFKKWKKSA